jgi:hypothetical protein
MSNRTYSHIDLWTVICLCDSVEVVLGTSYLVNGIAFSSRMGTSRMRENRKWARRRTRGEGGREKRDGDEDEGDEDEDEDDQVDEDEDEDKDKEEDKEDKEDKDKEDKDKDKDRVLANDGEELDDDLYAQEGYGAL